MKYKNFKGIFPLLFSVTLFGMYGILTKLISPNYGLFYSSVVILSISVIGIMPLFLPIFNSKPIIPFKKPSKPFIIWILVVGLSAAFSNPLSYLAFNELPISQVYFIQYVTIITLSILLSKLFFKEKITIINLISIFLTISGLVLICVDNFDFKANLFGFLYALLLGVSIASYNSFSKNISEEYHPMQGFLMVAIISVTFSLIGAFLTQEHLPFLSSNSANISIIIFGIIAIGANYFLFLGYKYLPVSIATLFTPLDMVIGSVAGILLFKEETTILIALGGLLILLAAMLPSLNEIVNKRKR